jgi:hypothetical protein
LNKGRWGSSGSMDDVVITFQIDRFGISHGSEIDCVYTVRLGRYDLSSQHASTFMPKGACVLSTKRRDLQEGSCVGVVPS